MMSEYTKRLYQRAQADEILAVQRSKARIHGAGLGISCGNVDAWTLDALMAFNLACDRLLRLERASEDSG